MGRIKRKDFKYLISIDPHIADDIKNNIRSNAFDIDRNLFVMQMRKIVDYFKYVEKDIHVLQMLFYMSDTLFYEKGQRLFDELDPTDYFYFIL